MTLKKYLTQTKVSVAKFSQVTGINPNTLQTYVHQTSEPTVSNAIKIIEATHGSVKLKDLKIKK